MMMKGGNKVLARSLMTQVNRPLSSVIFLLGTGSVALKSGVI